MVTIKEIDRNLYLLHREKLVVDRELEENPGLTTDECGQIAVLQNRQQGLWTQIHWWVEQRGAQKLIAKFNGHDELAQSIPVSDFLGSERLNGSGQRKRRRNHNQFVRSAEDLKHRTGKTAGVKKGKKARGQPQGKKSRAA